MTNIEIIKQHIKDKAKGEEHKLALNIEYVYWLLDLAANADKEGNKINIGWLNATHGIWFVGGTKPKDITMFWTNYIQK